MTNKLVDLAPFEKIVIDEGEGVEIRIYNGDKDPNLLNRKRIGIYLFINNNFAASEWIECGKLVNSILMNDPKMTLQKKDELTNLAIANMKNKWFEIKSDNIIHIISSIPK